MIEIVDATPDGWPRIVICSICDPDPNSVWVRPADDPTANTLAGWIRTHHRDRRLRPTPR